MTCFIAVPANTHVISGNMLAVIQMRTVLKLPRTQKAGKHVFEFFHGWIVTESVY